MVSTVETIDSEMNLVICFYHSIGPPLPIGIGKPNPKTRPRHTHTTREIPTSLDWIAINMVTLT